MFPFNAMFNAIQHIDSPLKFAAYLIALGATIALVYMAARNAGL